MSVVLQHPYTSPTLTLTLPNPTFGNGDTLNIKTNFNFAMDGTIRSYIKTPESHKLTMQFNTLRENTTCGSISYDQVTEIIDFIEAAGGDDIKVTDWNSEVWRVKIITSPAQFVQNNRTFHEAILEFEGAIISEATYVVDEAGNYIVDEFGNYVIGLVDA